MEYNLSELVGRALLEDRSDHDITTQMLQNVGVDPFQPVSFYVQAKSSGVFSGVAWAKAFEGISQLCHFEEGKNFKPGDRVLSGLAPWSRVLSFERTLLNGLQYFCGVASLTYEHVKRVEEIAQKKQIKNPPKIYHTRKILPGLREPVLLAVKAGGACEHRVDLSSRILFKENHKYVLQNASRSFADYVAVLREHGLLADALIEVESLMEAYEWVGLGVENLLLDNFSPTQIFEAITHLPKNISLEASGGIQLGNLDEYVIDGLDRISMGSMTHSAVAKDLSLDFDFEVHSLKASIPTI